MYDPQHLALAPGTRLGPYEVLSLIGRGGMGEVYRATDTHLKRAVAIKVLPESVAGDAERLARFQREAEVLASLNHPNIAHIHGLEKSAGLTALVMELVEGDDLSQRLARGAIPLDEALPIAKQIAEALEAAHEQGIIHRDLKPANIKVRGDGVVKVLDFGLAKALEPPASSPNRSQSPTMTTPAMTRAGMILGTAAYMSPEQAKGRPADKRSDIWAFGAVLYEMLTRTRAFGGDDVSDTLAAILTREPDWAALPANTPPLIYRLLRRCLEKDRKRRLADAADVRLEIEEALTTGSGAPVPAGPLAWTTHRGRVLLGLGVLAIVVASVTLTTLVVGPLRRSTGDASFAVARLLIGVAPADQLLGVEPDERNRSPRRPSRTAMALSPNGQQLVFSAMRGDTQQLYLRALDRLDATPMAGTDNSDSPFFSPDGQWVGFWKGGELKKVPVNGGPVVTICKTISMFGASWGSNDTIIFARRNEGLWQVPAAGGTPRSLTTLKKGEVSHRLPHILPGGKAVLFTIQRSQLRWDSAQIVVRSLVTGEQTMLIEGGADARYVPSGHLVYARLGTLMAAPFDLAHLKLTGGAVGILDGVMQAVNTTTATDTGAAQFSVSGSGALVYVPGGVFPDVERSLVWVDRTGASQALPVPPRAYLAPRLSPDGQRVAVYTAGMDRNVWVYDLLRGTLSHFTTEGQNAYPVWTPDGKRLTFDSATTGAANLFWKPADGSGAAERLTTSEYGQSASSWSPDGKTLAFVQPEPTTRWDIWTLSLADRDRTPRPFLRTAADEAWPDFSPDGRWLAYGSDESGRYEVYVQPYPGPGQRFQISAQGGTSPAWARNGRELFYAVPDPNSTSGKMMAVDVATTPTFTAGVPRALESVVRTSASQTRGYDVTPDARRFITTRENVRPEPPPAQMTLVLNWVEELKRRVPVK